MIELTDDQWHEINAETPSRIRNPRTDETFVLIRAEVYERMRAIINAITERAGWADPKLDVYEQLRKRS